MMPFALDLISTLVIGSILPVATTDRVIVARSTVASRAGSIVEEAPRSVENPHAAAMAITTTMPPIRLRFFDFFITSVVDDLSGWKVAATDVSRGYIRTVKPCGC